MRLILSIFNSIAGTHTHSHIRTHEYHLPSLSTYTPFNEKKWLRRIAIVAYHLNELIISFCLFACVNACTLMAATLLTASKIIMLSYKNSTSDVHLVRILSLCLFVCVVYILVCFALASAFIFGQTFHWLNKNLYTIKKLLLLQSYLRRTLPTTLMVNFIFT